MKCAIVFRQRVHKALHGTQHGLWTSSRYGIPIIKFISEKESTGLTRKLSFHTSVLNRIIGSRFCSTVLSDVAQHRARELANMSLGTKA